MMDERWQWTVHVQILFYWENPGCLRQGLQGLSAWEVERNEERQLTFFFHSTVSCLQWFNNIFQDWLQVRDNFLWGLISCIPSSCSWPLIMSLYINFNNTSNTNVLSASKNKHLRQLHLQLFFGVISELFSGNNEYYNDDISSYIYYSEFNTQTWRRHTAGK